MLAVVLILAALLFPVVGRVREKGRQASCQSNLHQIYLGLVQYVQDNDSHLPNGLDWPKALDSYVKSQSVFFCPSTPQPRVVDPHRGDAWGIDYTYHLGLLNGLSFTAQANGLPKATLVGVNEASTLSIPDIVVSLDAGLFTGNFEEVPLHGGADCGITNSWGVPEVSVSASTIHNGGANELFYDGHIKWETPTDFAKRYCKLGKYVQPPFRAGGPHAPRS